MEDLAIRCSICTIGSCALQALGRDEVVRMEEHASHATFCRGEMLLRQDTPFHSIIYLRSGLVKEFMIHRNNRDQIIQVIKPRSYIGLQSFFTNTKSVFSYRAITPVEICYIEKETFSELISGNGYFAREIMTSMSMETLSNQQRILGLIQKQIFGKVAEMLLYFADQIF